MFKAAQSIPVVAFLLVTAFLCSGCPAGTDEQVETTSDRQQTEQNQSGVRNSDDQQQTPDNGETAPVEADAEAPPADDSIALSEIRQKYPKHAFGIDVSHHQGTINWQEIADTGLDFVYVKATEGIDYVDPLFLQNWKELGEAGLHHGAYHMFRPEDTAEEQVANFVGQIRKAGITDLMLTPVLDIERVSTTDSVSKDLLHQRSARFLKMVEDELGVKPMVYTSPKFWEDYLQNEHELIDYHLWVSEYDKGRSEPASTGGWSAWKIWQFSRYGLVEGIPVSVDLNRVNGGHTVLSELLAGSE